MLRYARVSRASARTTPVRGSTPTRATPPPTPPTVAEPTDPPSFDPRTIPIPKPVPDPSDMPPAQASSAYCKLANRHDPGIANVNDHPLDATTLRYARRLAALAPPDIAPRWRILVPWLEVVYDTDRRLRANLASGDLADKARQTQRQAGALRITFALSHVVFADSVFRCHPHPTTRAEAR